MLTGIINQLNEFFHTSRKSLLPEKEINYINHIENGYPSNHTYRIKNKILVPKYKLASRFKKINQLFPTNLTSILEIGCSKGFFIFSGSNNPHFTRGLGIDVDAYNIETCNWVKEKINNRTTQFKNISLEELVENIDHFGGPFQTILIINTYQYLYFGSDPYPKCYLDHDTIFKQLRKICSGRIIFNNRIDLADCQNIDRIEKAPPLSVSNYSKEKALEIAAKYFVVKEHGSIGRYPLLTFDLN